MAQLLTTICSELSAATSKPPVQDSVPNIAGAMYETPQSSPHPMTATIAAPVDQLGVFQGLKWSPKVPHIFWRGTSAKG